MVVVQINIIASCINKYKKDSYIHSYTFLQSKLLQVLFHSKPTLHPKICRHSKV